MDIGAIPAGVPFLLTLNETMHTSVVIPASFQGLLGVQFGEGTKKIEVPASSDSLHPSHRNLGR